MLSTQLSALPQDPLIHRHVHHQLVLSTCGRGEIDLNGLQAPLNGLHACVVESNADHAFFGEQGNRIIVINLDPGDEALNAAHHPDYDALAPLFDHSRLLRLSPQVRALAQACMQTLSQAPEDPVLNRALGTSLLRACLLQCAPEATSRVVQRYRLDLARIDAWIQTHLSRPISMADLAGSVCLSPGWFQQAFKRATGTTPARYVQRKRLEHAHHLLLTTDWPLSRIAAECGLSDQSTLSRAFKRHFGCPPSQLRT